MYLILTHSISRSLSNGYLDGKTHDEKTEERRHPDCIFELLQHQSWWQPLWGDHALVQNKMVGSHGMPKSDYLVGGMCFSKLINNILVLIFILASIWISGSPINGTGLLGHSCNLLYYWALVFHVRMHRWPTSRLHAPTQIWQPSETACGIPQWLD